MKIQEDINDIKITIKQPVEIDNLDDTDIDINEINNLDDVIERFYEDFENQIEEFSNNKQEWNEWFEEIADNVKLISLVDLDENQIIIKVLLNKPLRRDVRDKYFKTLISDCLMDNLESQEATYTVTDNFSDYWDYDKDEPAQRPEPDYEDEVSVYLKTKGNEVLIDGGLNSSSSLGESKVLKETNTEDFFADFEYTESDYDRFLNREASRYMHDTYGGNDIKRFDKLIKSELEDNSLDFMSLRDYKKDWIDLKMKEARQYIKESLISEDMKDGIKMILDKFKDKILFKYQGSKKDKDGDYYDTYACKIKKAGIFDLVSFEEKLKELANKVGVILKVVYPNDHQDHASFWVKGRYKNEIMDTDGSRYAYESKKLKESKNDDDEEWKRFCQRMKRLGFLELTDMDALSDYDFIDKISFDDLDMFHKLEMYSYQEIQDMIRRELAKNESVISDYAKLKTQLNKEKQFNKKTEINDKLNKLIKDNNLEFKDQSSGDNNEYQKVFSNGKDVGTIQISKSGKVSVYETESLENKVKNAELAKKLQDDAKKNGFHKIITLDVNDYYGDIEAMLNYIGTVAEWGHSFTIEVDPHDEENRQVFSIDGDGSDRLKITNVETLDDNEEEEDK